MIRSMTGYASSESQVADVAVTIEAKSYNNRHLDTSIRMPSRYGTLEERIQKKISDVIFRGRVEMRFTITRTGAGNIAYEVDTDRAKAYAEAVNTLKESLSLEEEIPLANLLRLDGVVLSVESDIDIEDVWAAVEPCVDNVLEDLVASRQREGDYLKSDMTMRMQLVESSLNDVEALAGDMAAIYLAKLQERIGELTSGIKEIDPDRIAQEAAILSDRSDITEEIVRARSHIKLFHDIVAGEEAGGRKLNFLLQEFNREFNTIGSKSGRSEISHHVVSVKSELEKIREQVQNVE